MTKRNYKTIPKDSPKNSSKPQFLDYRSGKNHLDVIQKKGEVMDTCATIHNEYICCNVKVLKSVSNCPYDCSYCFLQNYLNDGKTSVIGDIDGMMDEVKSKIEAQPWRVFRIGTWELGDSLALEDETGQAQKLIPEFAKLNNVLLELKTKSDCVDKILDLPHQGKTVVSWSMNTQTGINTQEHRTARLEERLIAIEKVVKAGYLVGIHFDPMLRHPNWEKEYPELVRRVFDVCPPQNMAWMSFGSLRFNPEMKQKIEQNFPSTDITFQEMVKGPDGKVRYVKPLRLEMYHTIYEAMRKYGDPSVLIYLCMERWDVWEKVMGYSPTSIGDLDYLFAKSLWARYPHLGLTEPCRKLYEKYQDS